ncbi:hypothetical protein NDU88_002047 [Pleurodeles waltl]|uniref:Uncharacterized protein n=1 Tax=Pleurodeles waltl TaxID=8319 RepID=A0AAV7P8V2_PLEWA|nr:hypothetical protein NDU88_002047 [Pleurodeles waltl]
MTVIKVLTNGMECHVRSVARSKISGRVFKEERLRLRHHLESLTFRDTSHASKILAVFHFYRHTSAMKGRTPPVMEFHPAVPRAVPALQ